MRGMRSFNRLILKVEHASKQSHHKVAKQLLADRNNFTWVGYFCPLWSPLTISRGVPKRNIGSTRRNQECGKNAWVGSHVPPCEWNLLFVDAHVDREKRHRRRRTEHFVEQGDACLRRTGRFLFSHRHQAPLIKMPSTGFRESERGWPGRRRVDICLVVLQKSGVQHRAEDLKTWGRRYSVRAWALHALSGFACDINAAKQLVR